MDKKIRLSGIAYESLVNGPGIRRVFFSQGCNHNCKGCFNPDTHDFNGGEEKNIDELIEDVLCNPKLSGLLKNDKVMKMLKDIAKSNGGSLSMHI